MKTIKRTIPNIDTSLANTTKYFNQLEFKGIIEDSNIFTIDQESFRDVQNVYVNGDDHFVSRDPLQKDITVPANAIPFTFKLVDYLTIGSNKIFISQSPTTNKYAIILFTEDNVSYPLENLTQYHIATIEHYIICFNDVSAKVFDTNNPSWQDLATSDLIEIPVIKRVVGSQITEYNKNEFTSSYKEEYVWSNQSRPILPDASLANNVSVVLNTPTKKYDWTIPSIQINTDYRILRQINIIPQATDIITIAQDRICIARDTYFLVSLNGGTSFTTVYYPEFGGTIMNIASISKDGQYFFFVTTAGVYKCYLGDFTWAEAISVYNNATIKGTAIYNACNFLTGDIFCFITKGPTSTYSDTLYIYCKGSGIYPGDDPTITGQLVELSDNSTDANGILTYANQEYQDMYRNSIVINTNNIRTIIAISIPVRSQIYDNSTQQFVTVIHSQVFYVYGDNMSNYFSSGSVDDRKNILLTTIDHNNEFDQNFINDLQFIVLQNISPADPGDLTMGANISCLTQERNTLRWYQSNITLAIDIQGANSWATNSTWTKGVYINQASDSIPFKLDGGYINGSAVYSDITQRWISLPTQLDGQNFLSLVDGYNKKGTWVNGDYFYIQASNGLIYTNRLLDNDSVLITYTYIVNTPFTKIPEVSYSDTELYLAFGDLLQITENSRNPDDNTKIQFNLPTKNNQSFIDNITAMINISTTDVALFFKNKIVLCSKVEDANLGYRYDYYNTKLSMGVRLGDSVINTLEGSYTVFPTIRGLAIMNYQAFMATTDQVVEYLTDEVKGLWDGFYSEGSPIKIIQWRNHLVMTNGSKDMLLYNIVRKTWWRWKLPFNTLIAITDQLDLRIITRGELCIFTDKYLVNNEVKNLKYYDFSAHGENITINWFIQSQPLHMKAPNYYKNLKQLIFQLFTDSEDEETNTMNAQIKLYRKRITLREPDTVSFKIEKLRTFVKRFNYWKINEMQWGLANDTETSNPAKFRLNAISIKYELGEEVR